MGWATGAAVYAIIWWLVLFLVLPWGVGGAIGEEDVNKGHAAGAPRRPRLPIKLAVTTLVASVLFGAVYWIVESGIISFRE